MTVDEMRRELQGRLNKNRFAHSIGVANTAVKLAKKFNIAPVNLKMKIYPRRLLNAAFLLVRLKIPRRFYFTLTLVRRWSRKFTALMIKKLFKRFIAIP